MILGTLIWNSTVRKGWRNLNERRPDSWPQPRAHRDGIGGYWEVNGGAMTPGGMTAGESGEAHEVDERGLGNERGTGHKGLYARKYTWGWWWPHHIGMKSVDSRIWHGVGWQSVLERRQ